MECQGQEIDNVMLVRIAGRVDHTTAKAFEDTLLPLLDGPSAAGKKALLDLSGVVYMSSAGLRVLTLAAKQCKKQDSDMVIAALPSFLQEVFRIGRLDLVFKVFPTVQEALAILSPAAASAYDQS